MKLNWRQSIIYVTIMGMEGCWLYALLVLLNNKTADGRLSILGLLPLYPVAFGLNKLLQGLGWHRVFRDTANVLAWGIGTLIMVKAQLFSSLALTNPAWLLAIPQAIANIFYAFAPELLILVGSAVLWWLGRRLAHIQIGFTNSVSEFQFGMFMLIILLFVISVFEVKPANLIPVTLAFFFSALLGMSVAHAREGASWLTGLYQGQWSGLLLVSISLILILGLLVGSVITQDLLQLILLALKWVWGLITQAIAFLISLLPEPSPPEIPPEMLLPAPTPVEEPEWHKFFVMPEAVRSGIRFGWTILMCGFIIFALWQISSGIFGWLRSKLANTAGAEVEPLKGAFIADLLGLLKRIVFWLLGLRRLLRWQRKPPPPEVTSIRQIYRQLLRWTAKRGWPRPVFQTPNEYLHTLEGLIPESGDALRLVTQNYVSSRYGISSPTDEEMHRLKQSWHQIKQNRLRQPDSGVDN